MVGKKTYRSWTKFAAKLDPEGLSPHEEGLVDQPCCGIRSLRPAGDVQLLGGVWSDPGEVRTHAPLDVPEFAVGVVLVVL